METLKIIPKQLLAVVLVIVTNVAISQIQIPNVIRISISNDIIYDEIAIRYTDRATSGFDSNFDALKIFGMASNSVSIYSSFTDKNGENWSYAINSIPFTESKLGVPLHHKVDIDGKYSLIIKGIESFDSTTCIYIEDLETKTIIDLIKSKTYEFTEVKTSKHKNRFVIRTFAKPIPKLTNEEFGNDGTIMFKVNTKVFSELYCSKDSLIKSTASSSNIISFNNLKKGNYKVVITPDELNCPVIKQEIKICGNNYDLLTVKNEKCGKDGSITILSSENITANLSSKTANTSITSVDSIIFKDISVGSYSLTIKNNETSCPTNTQKINIDIKPYNPINISFLQRTNATCKLNNGIIVVSASGGKPPYNYCWSNGKSTRFNDNLKSGQYSVIVTDSLGCKKKSNPISISNVIVKADFDFITFPTDKERKISIINKSTNCNNYSWSYGDGDVYNFKNPYIKSYTADGDYIVNLIVKSDNHCIDSISKVVSFRTEKNKLEDVVFQDNKNIVFEFKNDFDGNILCYSNDGNLVYSKNLQHITGSILKIDMENLVSGIYFFTLQQADNIQTKKINYVN